MHDYAIDRHPKQKVLFALSFLSITITPFVNSTLSQAASSLGYSNAWVTTIGTAVPVFVMFGLLYLFFDRYLWKWAPLRKLLLVPDLNGIWRCEGETALKKGEPADFTWQSTITISQSWSKMLIHLKTEQSSSSSTSASIFHEQGVGYRLLYQYKNEPRADELELSNHAGSAEIKFSEDCLTGEGHYYTDQHRNTVGTMSLRREDVHSP